MLPFYGLSRKVQPVNVAYLILGLLSRIHRNIGVAIWRRVVAMVHKCAPSLNDSPVNLLSGPCSIIECIFEIDINGMVCTGLAM